MELPENVLKITADDAPGYHPLARFEGWRVAVYNERHGETPGGIAYLEKHLLTDEVFLLLKGNCTLLLCEEETQPMHIRSIPMEPLKCYNIRKGVWHNLTLSGDGAVAIVENDTTSKANSEFIYLNNAAT